jgi:pimeloyl-ACP methyl ester carboxylesterase
MMSAFRLCCCVAALASPAALRAQQVVEDGGPEGVRIESSDGITLYADLHRSVAGPSAPVIVLFHQAGSNARGEYREIVPRLLEQDFNVLAVDLRLGGSLYGGRNRTVDAGSLPDSRDYCTAYPDVVAAWDYVIESGFTGARFAWGSSYSAALVVRLAAERPGQMSAALAFSPASGDPMAGCRPEQVLPSLSIPVLVLRPEAEAAIPTVADQLDRFRAAGKQTHIARPGAHGSSMLSPSRVEGDTEPTWTVVLRFLHAQSSRPGGEIRPGLRAQTDVP